MLKASLQLRLGQQLTMTPQLQQAIRLLQLPSLELQAHIRELLESNVMLEVDEDAWAHADEERIQQIARALTGNALVHTPPGTTVRLRVEQRGSRVALAVEDNGPGIPAEHVERVFQRFYRVEGGQASGSGLGLAIARELAGRMGGTVTVTSRPGSTVFTLELPAEGAPLRPPAPLPA